MKVKLPLHETEFLLGVKNICKFIDENQLFKYEVEDDPNLGHTVEKFIDENIVPHLNAMFWHPMLTYYTTFHTNLSSFTRVNINYKLISIFNTNMYRTAKNIILNLANIVSKRN